MDALEYYVRTGLGIGIIMLLGGVLIPLCVLMMPWRAARVRLCNRYGKVVGPIAAWLTKADVRIHNREGLDGSYPAIYISNHTSNLDVLLAMWLCPVGGCGVAKKQIAAVPVFGQLYWLSGHLLVDRENRERAVASLKETAEFVRSKRLGLWIWPEGTRSANGRLIPFKKGLAHMAIATGLPIVPVVVHNAHKNWGKNQLRLNRVVVDINVLPPISTEGWSTDTISEHLAMVHGVVADALGPDQKPAAAE